MKNIVDSYPLDPHLIDSKEFVDFVLYGLQGLVIAGVFTEGEYAKIKENILSPTYGSIRVGRLGLADGDSTFAIYVRKS